MLSGRKLPFGLTEALADADGRVDRTAAAVLVSHIERGKVRAHPNDIAAIAVTRAVVGGSGSWGGFFDVLATVTGELERTGE